MTLIEVLVALALFLVVSLAMLQTSVLTLDNNMRNSLRDEAISIGEQRIADARNVPFDSLAAGTTAFTDSRKFRGSTTAITFTSSRTVTDRGTDIKQVDIAVTWSWKGRNLTHTVRSVVRKPS